MTEGFVCISFLDDYVRSKALSFVDYGRRRKLTSTWCLLGHASKLTFLSAFSGNLDRGHYDVLQIVGGEDFWKSKTNERFLSPRPLIHITYVED